MDIITHALLGAAIAPNKALVVPMTVSSIVPDLWTVPPLVEYLVTHRGRYRNSEFWRWIPAKYDQLTKWSHSLVPLVIAGLISGVVLRISPWVFLPWLLHLLIDIPTHARSRTGFLLYPLSTWQPLGAKNWYDMWWFSIITICVLGVVVVVRFLR